MTAAFWSRFKRLLLSRSYRAIGRRRSLWGTLVSGFACQARRASRARLRRRYVRALAFGDVTLARSRSAMLRSLRFGQVTGARRIHLDAGALGGGHHDRADVLALGGGRLGADQLLDDGLVVAQQLVVVERGLSDRHVDDRRAVGAVLDLAGLGLLDGLADVHRYGADLRVRHLALRAQDAAEAADHRHHVGRRDRDVEVGEAVVLHALGEVVGAHEVGAGLLGLAGLVAFGEHGDRHVLAQPVRQRDRAAQLLVRVAHVQAGAHVYLDRFVELRALEVLDEAHRLMRGVLALAVDVLARVGVGLAALGHYATTSTPIERAVPSMILAA